MIDEHDRIAVGEKVVHNADESFEVGRMEANRGFIEHVKHAGCPVAHGAGELHALSFSR